MATDSSITVTETSRRAPFRANSFSTISLNRTSTLSSILPVRMEYSNSLSRKHCCMYVLVLLVVMSSVLAAVIVVPIVNSHVTFHKKYQTHVVSVMSQKEQRRLIMLAKQECFKRSREQEVANNTELESCKVTWDGMLCWDETPPQKMASQACPDYVNGFNKHALATKICTQNGSWWINPDPVLNHEWTNFSECVKPSIDLSFHTAHGDKLRLLYTIGYSFSLGALLVAVIIMLCSKRLHSKSNTLHINLFLAFILRATISFLKDILFVRNVGLAKDVKRGEDGILQFVQDAPHWECKLLITVFMYSVNACNMWIFAEALYLTMLVYRPLTTERQGMKGYVILGWTLPLAFIIPWIFIKLIYEDTFCWNIQHNPDFYWILRGPGVAVVVVNFFLFLNIFRKLFFKLRHTSQLGACNKSKYRKLAKFILVLIPLFGIMYIVFYVAVPSNFEETDFNVAYLYLEMGYNSFQGFLLALLFCFLNEEVHGELKRVWYRHRSRRVDLTAINRSYLLHSTNRKANSKKANSRRIFHQKKGCKTTSMLNDPKEITQRSLIPCCVNDEPNNRLCNFELSANDSFVMTNAHDNDNVSTCFVDMDANVIPLNTCTSSGKSPASRDTEAPLLHQEENNCSETDSDLWESAKSQPNNADNHPIQNGSHVIQSPPP